MMDQAKVVDLIGRVPVLGSTLRKLARRYPEGSVVDVRTGVAAGLKWKRHHRYINGYWVGHFELEIQNALKRELKAGDVFYDVGANAGFFTLIGARLVGPSGRVVAFDPAPENCESVREQVELNGYAPFCTAVQKAVGGAAGSATFSFDTSGSTMGHLGGARRGERSVEVEVTTLDDAAAALGAPTFIKLDVEGAEGDVMAGAHRLLSSGAARPAWLIELHDPQCEAEVKRHLAAAGYHFFDLDARPVTAGAVLPHHVIARPG
jgi:FkbM family methyltransferase